MRCDEAGVAPRRAARGGRRDSPGAVASYPLAQHAAALRRHIRRVAARGGTALGRIGGGSWRRCGKARRGRARSVLSAIGAAAAHAFVRGDVVEGGGGEAAAELALQWCGEPCRLGMLRRAAEGCCRAVGRTRSVRSSTLHQLVYLPADRARLEQHSTAQHSAAQRSAAQRSAAQRSTAQRGRVVLLAIVTAGPAPPSRRPAPRRTWPTRRPFPRRSPRRRCTASPMD